MEKLGRVERRAHFGSRTMGDNVVILAMEGVEVRLGNKAPWTMTYETLFKVANEEILDDLKQVLDGEPRALTLRSTRTPKDRPLDMKRLGKLVGPLVGKKTLTPGTIRKYLRLLTIAPVGKHGKKPIYAPDVVQKVADRYKQMQAEVSKKASARYDPKTRRLGRKNQPA